MPAFSYEKISPPAHGAAVAPTPNNPHKKQRGVIVQVLDRITGARGKRSTQKEQPAPGPQPSKP